MIGSRGRGALGALATIAVAVLAAGGVGADDAAKAAGVEAFAKPAALPGLESGLAEIARLARAEGSAAALREARAGAFVTSGQRVEVVVRTDTAGRALAMAALATRGATVERSYGGLLKVLVPVGELESLGRAPGVSAVEAPLRFHPAALEGQGVAASNAAVAHGDGERGAGVKIGIIDAGFAQYLLRQAGGELPSGAALKTQN